MKKGFAVAALVLGIFSIILAIFSIKFNFLLGFIGFALGIIGLILGCVSIARKESARIPAISGIITSLIGIIVSPISIIVILFTLLTTFFSDFTKTTVERIIPSPNGQTRVELISYDEGALGGSTNVRVVKVNEQTELSVVGQPPVGDGERVAGGQWDDYKRMIVTWWDDEHFQIVIPYEYTSTCNIMDVDLSSDEIVTSGWYKEELTDE